MILFYVRQRGQFSNKFKYHQPTDILEELFGNI